MKKLLLVLILLFDLCYGASPYEATKNLPILYQGRFRSLDSTAQLWLYDISHRRSAGDQSALDVLWEAHLHGTPAIDTMPLFWIHYADTKQLLGLDLHRDRFTLPEVTDALKGKETSLQDVPEAAQLMLRLKNLPSDTSLRMLPYKQSPGAWVSLKVLERPENVTEFPDEVFQELRTAYLQMKEEQGQPLAQAVQRFSETYSKGYEKIQGIEYRRASGKTLKYPSQSALAMETFYYRTPLVDIAIVLYALALFALVLRWRGAYPLLLCGLAVHTATLILRSYILGRPPVTNMFETVIYVPWIAIVLAAIIGWRQHSRAIAGAGCVAAIALLVILKISELDARMENVQAVLDSQFWLLIHVLMVVGSYGAFILSGVLGHLYLLRSARGQKAEKLAPVARGILTTMYIGVGLLIPGTILGGIWAAESWGRFWDWDPKESWAFISACVYLVVIHAYTFKKIKDLGLALGSILGLISISFTWYGVNYILGTGLHSYGFGTASPYYYFGYLGAEVLFILVALILMRKARSSKMKYIT